MTFYEAAIEVLRKHGEPLHFTRITELAMEENLLSHVGRLPETTMQARLVAMSKQGERRQVVIVEPDVFGLSEWAAPHDEAAAAASEPKVLDHGAPLRSRERSPLTIQDGKAVREAERGGRFEAEDRDARTRGRRRRRRAKPGETPGEALAAILIELGSGPIDAQYAVDTLPRQPELPEGFPGSVEGLRTLAEEENQRRAEAGLPPAFGIEGDRLELLVAPPTQAQEQRAAPARAVRPTRLEEQAGETARALAAELRRLPPELFEQLVHRLGEHLGVVDVKLAKRSGKGSPLFTGFARLGVSQIRIAARVLVSGRDVRADDLDELRADLEHYSATAGLILTAGRVDRAARSRAEDMSQKPALLFDGEALAGVCIEAGIGVRVRLVETVEVDAAGLRSPGSER